MKALKVFLIIAILACNAGAGDVSCVVLLPPADGLEYFALMGASALIVSGVLAVNSNNKDLAVTISGITACTVGGFYLWYTIVTW